LGEEVDVFVSEELSFHSQWASFGLDELELIELTF